MQALRLRPGQGTARDRVALCGHRALRPVPHHQIGQGAGLEVANLSCQAQRLSGAARGRVQRRPGVELDAAQRLHLVGLGGGAQQAKRGAAAHIAGQADAVAGVDRGLPVEETTAQEEVAARAVGDVCTGIAQQSAVVGIEPDAVRQHGALVQQTGAVVDVEIAARLGVQLGHPAYLGGGLGHVRLHVQAGVAAAQLARHRQLCGRAGDGKAHRHRIGRAALAVPAPDEVFAVLAGAFDIVAQAVGGMAVHQHLAGDDAHAALRGGGKKGLGRDLVYRREDHRRRRAMRQQRVEKTRCGVGRHGRVGVAQLGGEGVGLQPVQQAGAPAADHVQLRAVHVGVDEARHQQAAAVVHTLPVGARVRGLCADDAPL